MSTNAISPLRQRMIEDMNARKLCAATQRSHIYSCKRFAAFLKRSPDTATAEDIRRFQLRLIMFNPITWDWSRKTPARGIRSGLAAFMCGISAHRQRLRRHTAVRP